MPPRKSRKANVKETPVVSDPLKFQNPNVEKYFLKLQGKTFIQEKGFQPLMILCKEIWSIVQYHRWERFCLIPKENVVIPIVQEFYIALRDEETRRPHSVRWEMVTVWGKDVSFTPKAICEFYDAPYYETNFLESTYLINFDDTDMDSIIKYLTENRGEWKYRSDIGLPTNFNQAIMFPIAKMWMQFICTSITPTLNVSNVNTFQAILLYEILQKKRKQNMDISASSKIKEAIKTPKGSKILEAEWMIIWMQESGLIIQVFARENNIKVLNYLPKIIDPDHSIANPTIREEKMRKEAEMKRRRPQSKTFKKEDDDYD
ncbi:hypothetical protein Gohar_008684 [Gossypium harknessii]|uniref:Putative plant transposon protein domain-containing protein n=1 Tax=Gossypium harknessii TaxID=34285 RepID=A0A7J9GKF6_9ROSI|nr:hypothetical protein [Gossypium harknessii]